MEAGEEQEQQESQENTPNFEYQGDQFRNCNHCKTMHEGAWHVCEMPQVQIEIFRCYTCQQWTTDSKWNSE